MNTLDFKKLSLREINKTLQDSDANSAFSIKNPKGSHALAVGINKKIDVKVVGSVGYYCAGMNKKSSIKIEGSAGPGLGENMMSGKIHVTGDVSQYAGASGHGGNILIEGNASSRCGISMKGVDIIVKGNVGHMSAFMAQKGTLVIFGDAGHALGDSIYEANIYVAGKVTSLGADCIEKKMTNKHIVNLKNILLDANLPDDNLKRFKRFGSSRSLYNFQVDNAKLL
tara:strand:- start:220 stop:897 length:678 start_codon:yes stop_codon:yes gene_type:complete